MMFEGANLRIYLSFLRFFDVRMRTFTEKLRIHKIFFCLMRKNNTLLVKILIGIAGFVILMLTIVLVMVPLRTASLTKSSKIAWLQAEETVAKLSLQINPSADIVRNYSYLAAHVIASNLIPIEKKREFLLTEIETMYQNEMLLNNFWCVLEPNALDGMDEHYINRMGSNAFGNFVPWFADGKLSATTDYDYRSKYYTIPQSTLSEEFIDPYWDVVNGQNVLMFSFAVPVLLNDQFLGVVGTDFYIYDLAAMIEENVSVIGSGKLITDEGIILVHNDAGLIGQFDQNDYDEIKNKLSEKKIFDGFHSLKGHKLYKVFAPIHMGRNNHPWFFIVEVPAEEVYAQARKTISLLAVIFVLLVLSVYFYIKLVEMNRELKRLHAVKDKLFSVIAHDLRSPIGSLISVLKLVNKKNLDAEMQAELLRDITSKVDDAYGLLDNLLRWSKSQMQGIVPVFAFFDVQEESLSVTDNLQAIANDKNIVLENHIGMQKVFADRDIFAVVLRNLVMNAIKYSFADGKITIASKPSEKMLVISVEDSGMGMPQEVQDNLFKLTETKSRHGTNNETGTGLGLVLCANFVKANGGNIWFSSAPDKGSTFYFSVSVMR